MWFFIISLAVSQAALAGALCTGHPSQCCGGEKSVCETVVGCEWVGGAYGSCSGSSSPCETFSDDELLCLRQGCTFGPNKEVSGLFCTGNPIPKPVCTGTPFACSGVTKYSCEKIQGCKASGTFPFITCDGTPTPCASFTENDDDACGCERQGCTYCEDPPNESETFYEAVMPLREDFSCYWKNDFTWVNPFGEIIYYETVVACEKCRPSTDGRVCYIELIDYLDAPELHLDNVMKIGDNFCACEFCDEGGAAFNCEDLLDTSNGSRVIGRDCNGTCIWSGEQTVVPSLIITEGYGNSSDGATSHKFWVTAISCLLVYYVLEV